jgi:hypothetical protein
VKDITTPDEGKERHAGFASINANCIPGGGNIGPEQEKGWVEHACWRGMRSKKDRNMLNSNGFLSGTA